jgi:hypothetical protein
MDDPTKRPEFQRILQEAAQYRVLCRVFDAYRLPNDDNVCRSSDHFQRDPHDNGAV